MLFRKLIRTMYHYKAQFISMIVMIFLAVLCMVGINSEWYGMEYEKNNYLEKTNVADYWIYSHNFTDENIDSIIESFDEAERKTIVDVNVLKNKTLSLNIVEKNEISKCYLVEGSNFNEEKGIWLYDIFASKNGLNG